MKILLYILRLLLNKLEAPKRIYVVYDDTGGICWFCLDPIYAHDLSDESHYVKDFPISHPGGDTLFEELENLIS